MIFESAMSAKLGTMDDQSPSWNRNRIQIEINCVKRKKLVGGKALRSF
jgi:hypothetical protein